MLASWGHLAIFQSTPKFKRLPIQVKSINSVHVQQSKYSFHFLSSGLILIQFIFVFVFHFASPIRIFAVRFTESYCCRIYECDFS